METRSSRRNLSGMLPGGKRSEIIHSKNKCKPGYRLNKRYLLPERRLLKIVLLTS
jgi:hypothetical protein